VTTGFYLLDHQNPHAPVRKDGRRFWGYPSRTKRVAVGVVHTAENLPDFEPPDTGAESVARYGATLDRAASWHDTVDSDGRIRMLPWDYTAFHVGNFNSPSVGLEIATQARRWAEVPGPWKGAILLEAAAVVREWREQLGIPTRLITAAEAHAGVGGIIGHAPLDPTRRSDPGADFDWDGLVFLATYEIPPTPADPVPTPGAPMPGRVNISTDVVELERGASGTHVRKLQHLLNDVAGQGLDVDGDFGAATERAVTNFQAFLNLPDRRGLASAWTWHMLVTLPT
jgi:hypothetical protein